MKYLLALFLPILAFAHDIQPEIHVNNRILATVNGKSISVVDVMRKMDLYLARAYPEEAKSNATRYQFFTQNWKHTLQQLIDNELILADAEKMEVKIGDAEVREEIHKRFGPNVMASLDELGLAFEEAWHLIYSELAVQRMTGYRVYAKGMQKVGPQDIKEAFKEHLVKNPPKEHWKYKVLSIRSKTEKLGDVFAQKAYALIRNEPLPFESLAEKLKEDTGSEEQVTISVSDEFNLEDKELSKSHKAVLATLQPRTYSEPVAQVSRVDKTIVNRIFYLIDHVKESPPSFDSMVDPLHDELVQKEITKEYPKYLAKLRKLFNFEQSTFNGNVPSDFEPFTLQ